MGDLAGEMDGQEEDLVGLSLFGEIGTLESLVVHWWFASSRRLCCGAIS